MYKLMAQNAGSWHGGTPYLLKTKDSRVEIEKEMQKVKEDDKAQGIYYMVYFIEKGK